MNITSVVISICLMAVPVALKGQSGPPSPYIDKGACPFEGCVYRTWAAKKKVDIFAGPNSRTKVGVVNRGEQVTGITGEVHSVPMLVHAVQDVPDPAHPNTIMIPKGRAFYVIHYLGEGAWLCWSSEVRCRGKVKFDRTDPQFPAYMVNGGPFAPH